MILAQNWPKIAKSSWHNPFNVSMTDSGSEIVNPILTCLSKEKKDRVVYHADEHKYT